jgi:hypothetical protein
MSCLGALSPDFGERFDLLVLPVELGITPFQVEISAPFLEELADRFRILQPCLDVHSSDVCDRLIIVWNGPAIHLIPVNQAPIDCVLLKGQVQRIAGI